MIYQLEKDWIRMILDLSFVMCESRGNSVPIVIRTASVFLLKIISAVVVFLLQIILAQHLGINEYGDLSLFLAISNVFVLFPLLGMNTGLIKEVSAAENIYYQKWILRFTEKSFIVLCITTGVIWQIISPIVLAKLSLDITMSLLLVLFSSIVSFSTLLSGFIQGEKKNILNDSIVTLGNILRLILVYCIIRFSANIQDVLVVYVFVEAIVLLIRFFNIESKFFFVPNTYCSSWQEKRSFLQYCLPLFFVSSISIIQFNIHKFIISGMMDNYSVGIMKVCENYSSALGLFVAPFITFWPVMSEYYHKHETEKLKKLFKQGSIVITATIIPTFVVLLVCIHDIMFFFHLDTYIYPELTLIFFAFSIGTIYDAIIGPAGALLNMTKYSYISFYNSLLLLICTVAFSFFLIPYFGILGAAFALSLSHIVINTLNAYQNKRFFDLQPYGREQLELICLAIPVYWMLKLINYQIGFSGIGNIFFFFVITYSIYSGFCYVRYREIIRTWRKSKWAKH
jgi:O-antigen/teichoic acid export membrane protein